MRNILLAVFFIFAVGCSDSNDPSTESKADLNPPSGLNRIIQDASVNLYWQGNNPEKDFQGYYVFGSKTAWTDLRTLIKYPSGQASITWQKSTGIPRCKDNNNFFAKFGIPTTETACEKSGITDSSSGSMTTGTQSASTTNEFKNVILNCNDRTEDLQLSLKPTSGGATFVVGSAQTCVVKKAYNTTSSALEDISNGESLTFMAMSVMGDDLTKVSWTSNIIEAAGSKEIVIQDLVISSGKFKTLDFSALISGNEVNYSGGGTCSTSICSIGKINTETDVDSPKIWLARHGSNNAQRIMISSSSNAGNMEIYPTGNLVYSPLDPGSVSTRTPDTPSESGYLKGEIFAVYGLNTFDFKLKTSDAKTHYGKIVITSITYADETNVGTSDATVKLSVVYQPGASLVHYLHSDLSPDL